MHILRPLVSLILWLFERIVPFACSLYCWIAQIQARRRGSAVSPEPMLYAYAITAVFLWHSSIFIATSNVYCLYLLNSIYTLNCVIRFFQLTMRPSCFVGEKYPWKKGKRNPTEEEKLKYRDIFQWIFRKAADTHPRFTYHTYVRSANRCVVRSSGSATSLLWNHELLYVLLASLADARGLGNDGYWVLVIRLDNLN